MKKSNFSLSVLTVLLFTCTLFTVAYGQVITNFLPTTTSAGTGSQITITGSGFGPGPASITKYIEFANSDNGGQTGVKPALVEYVSWADDKIVVIVPSRAGTGSIKVYNGTSTGVSSSSLTVSYNIINVSTFQLKHVDANTQGGSTWQLELGFNGQSNAKNSFLKSLSAWTCFTGINWKVGAPTPANQTGRDGINIVRFDTGTELPAGVLGVAYTYYSSCGSNKWQITETDLVFDKERNWNFEDALPASSEMDFQSVVEKYDSPKTYFYMDPPYWKTENYYSNHDFDVNDHTRLADCIKNIQGKFSLSYYDFPKLSEWFPKEEYRWEQKNFKKAASAKKDGTQNEGTEFLIMS